MKTASLIRACMHDPDFKELARKLSKKKPRPTFMTVVTKLREHEVTVNEDRQLTRRGHSNRGLLATQRKPPAQRSRRNDNKPMCKSLYKSKCKRHNCPYLHLPSRQATERAHVTAPKSTQTTRNPFYWTFLIRTTRNYYRSPHLYYRKSSWT